MVRQIALLLVASCLCGCQVEPDRAAEPANDAGPSAIPAQAPCDPAGPPADTPAAPGVDPATAGVQIPGRTVLYATFPDGSLVCGYWDGIHAPPEPLQQGHGHVDGSVPTGTPTPDGLLLAVTAPPTIPGDKTPSIGVFSTNLDFGPGSVFAVQATFQEPTISFLDPSARAWATSVTARTGGQDDLKSEARLNVSVRVKGATASMNIIEVDQNGGGQRDNKVIDGELKANIFEKHLPYTIRLSVDRMTGKGQATLTSGNQTLSSKTFDLAIFLPSSGPTITAVGPTLANCCVPGAKVTVLVSDFRISRPSRRRDP